MLFFVMLANAALFGLTVAGASGDYRWGVAAFMFILALFATIRVALLFSARDNEIREMEKKRNPQKREV